MGAGFGWNFNVINWGASQGQLGFESVAHDGKFSSFRG